MSIQVRGYAAHGVNQALSLFKFERRELRPDDVQFEILYCGVCHSDYHHINGDWNSRFPIVPGHEVIGRVTRVGANVTRFKIGDAVGVGCMVDSCQHCRPCLSELEQYCEEGSTLTYNSLDRRDQRPTYGGYSETMIATEKFILKIPEGLDLAGAAPLLCAGITTYSPLRHWNVGLGTKLGVIGLGGLGHMAIKFAHAMGAEVTLFSRSPDKQADAMRLGTHHVVISSDPEQMKACASSLDVIIDTVPNQHDIKPYINCLALDGHLVMVGLLDYLKDSLNTIPLLLGRRSIAGSVIGGIAETQEMLDFCGEHNIVSDIEIIPIQAINQSYQRMLNSDVKYRFVIDMASLKSET